MISTSPSPLTATMSARRPSTRGSSVTLEKPRALRSLLTPRAITDAVSDCRPSSGRISRPSMLTCLFRGGSSHPPLSYLNRPAGDVPPLFAFERRLLGPAAVERERTAWIERTSGRRGDRRRRLARQEDALALRPGIGDRRGGEKRARIGMLRAFKD